MGTGIMVQQDDGTSDFTQLLILDLGTQLLKCFTVSSTCEFQQVDNLLLQETESPPSGPVWMDAPPAIQSLSCSVKFSIQTTHALNCTVLHKCLPVY
jgi:hypothetical protein